MTQLSSCARCPRLTAERRRIRLAYPDHHAAPVGSWGVPRPQVWIVGLAPGLHGAGRTGKAFVGDASGKFLFAALHRTGFATSADPHGASLRNARITNIVKCVPPANSPTAAEVQSCNPYLREELAALHGRPRRTRVVIALGGVAHRVVARTLGAGTAAFAHGQHTLVRPHVHLLASFHPSRLNVNTGRLTAPMLDAVLTHATLLLQRG